LSKFAIFNLFQYLKEIFFSRLAKSSVWLFAGGITGGILGYVFQITMGRMLGVEQYGVFIAIIALMSILSSPLGTLTMMISRRASAFIVEAKQDSLTHMFQYITIRSFLVACLFLVPILLYTEVIQEFLRINNATYLYLLCALILISFPQSINNAYLQGLQYFKWISANGVIGVVLKLLIAIWLVSLGYGVSGALLAVVISSFVILIFSYILLRKFFKFQKNIFRKKDYFSFKTAFPVLIANISFAVMTQIDMVLVEYYFSENQAGIYAAASILGKVVMYLPGGIVIALFPMVAENFAKGKSSLNYLLQAITITGIICLAGAFFYYFFSGAVVDILYGESYKDASKILRYFGFAMLPMSLILIAEHFLIAMGRVLFAYLIFAVAPFQLLAIYLFHDSLMQIVIIIGITGLIMTTVGYSILFKTLSMKNEK
jgi:O-antigen/teichoic acid export membrane protein